MFEHDKLDVYQLALAYHADTDKFISAKLKGRPRLADQLGRASESIVMNIAEGAAKLQPLDKRRYYLSALGSASECASAYDLLLNLGVIDVSTRLSERQKLSGIVAMLTSMATGMAQRSGVAGLVTKKPKK